MHLRSRSMYVLVGCAVAAVVFATLAGSVFAFLRYQTQAVEERQLREFGHALMWSLPAPAEEGGQITLPTPDELGPDRQPPVSEATGKRFVYRPVTPSGERIMPYTTGQRIIAWSAVPPYGNHRAFLTNSFCVYWLRDREVDWATQTWLPGAGGYRRNGPGTE